MLTVLNCFHAYLTGADLHNAKLVPSNVHVVLNVKTDTNQSRVQMLSNPRGRILTITDPLGRAINDNN